MCSSSNKIKNPYLLFWYVYVPYPLKKFKTEFSFIVKMSFKYCFTLKLFFLFDITCSRIEIEIHTFVRLLVWCPPATKYTNQMLFALKGCLLLKRMQNTGSTFIIYLDNAPSKKKPVQKPLILLILFQSSGPNPPHWDPT